MKVGRHLFAVLAFAAALSTNAAVARHHHAGGSNGAKASGVGTPNQANPPTANGSQLGSAPATEGVTDHANADNTGKGGTEQTGPHSKMPKAGGKPNTGTATTPVNAHGHLHGVAPGGTPESGAGAPIDTSITVHQGRNALKGSREAKDLIKERVSKRSKAAIAPGAAAAPGNLIAPGAAIAPGTAPAHQPAHDDHKKVPVSPDGGRQRNAVGAVVDTSTKHTNSTASGTAVPANTPALTAGSPPQGPAAISPNTKPLAGGGPFGNSGASGTTQIGSHPSGTAPLAIATMGGPSINGSGMIRPGSGTGAVGGAAKIAAGVIGGSSFRPKHP